MRLVVCSMFDKASGVYGPPFCVAAVGQAVRSFSDQINRGGDDSVMSKHPSDFELYVLGGFDDTSGRFMDNDPVGPELLVAGASVAVRVGGKDG